MEWFKFYNNKWLSDLAVISLDPIDRLCFITLLCVTASRDDRNGSVTQYHEHRILTLTHLTPDDYSKGVGFTKRLADVGLINIDDDTTITIKNFEKRQNSNLSGAERAQRYREKAKVTTVTKKSDESNAREEKIREEKIREEDNTLVGEFKNVQLKEEELKKLVERYGRAAVKQLIDELSSYLKSSGKRYKDHYATLLNWARRKGVVEVPRRTQTVEVEQITPEQAARNAEMRENIKRMIKRI